jgi:hypothetical protein
MEIEEQDVGLIRSHDGTRLFKIKYVFKKDGKEVAMSPTDIRKEVMEMMKNHEARVKIQRTVERIASIQAPSEFPGVVFAYVMGWYNRKLVESYEHKYGEMSIECEEEPVSPERLKQITAKAISLQAEKLKEIANEIMQGGPSELMADSLDDI